MAVEVRKRKNDFVSDVDMQKVLVGHKKKRTASNLKAVAQ